jgi:hypothetical protein
LMPKMNTIKGANGDYRFFILEACKVSMYFHENGAVALQQS